MTFEELRGLIAEAEGEITLDQDIAVSGTVISDWASPNMAGSPMPKAAEKPDLGINDCTAYRTPTPRWVSPSSRPTPSRTTCNDMTNSNSGARASR